MDLMQGRPFSGRTLERLKKFLASVGLLYDDGVEMSVCACDDDGLKAWEFIAESIA